MITTMVENWPGYRDGIMGPDLMEEMRMQAQRFGATIVAGRVDQVDLSIRGPSSSWTDDGEYRAHTLIVATGASAKWLGLLSETAAGRARRLELRDV